MRSLRIKTALISLGILGITLLAIFATVFVLQKKEHRHETTRNFLAEKEDVARNPGVHKVPFGDEELFFKAVSVYPASRELAKENIKGGTVPHHLLASHIIADFFSRLKKEDVRTIILVGPNHYERGGAHAIVSSRAWETPFGIVEPDQAVLSDLRNQKVVRTDEEVISSDHSITAILPFIRYYLPKAKIVPLVLSGKTSEEELDALASELAKYVGQKGVMMVASVDFSHYLTNSEAVEKNKESLEALRNYDYGEIMSYRDDHMDSPSSIALLLKTMEATGTKKESVLHDTNSGELTEDSISQVTSYLSLSWEG